MTKAIVENGLRIGIHHIMIAGTPNKGRFDKPISCGGTWQWTRDGKTTALIGYAIRQTAQDHAMLELSYRISGEAISYSIQLMAQPCRFGGWRWFAFCPRTSRKVSKLYLPNGAKRFLSRQAYRLSYRSQCDAAGFDRACNRRNRILSRKLKSDDPQMPIKPKWMRWKTYDGWLEKLETLEDEMNVALIRKFNLPAHLW